MFVVMIGCFFKIEFCKYKKKSRLYSFIPGRRPCHQGEVEVSPSGVLRRHREEVASHPQEVRGGPPCHRVDCSVGQISVCCVYLWSLIGNPFWSSRSCFLAVGQVGPLGQSR